MSFDLNNEAVAMNGDDKQLVESQGGKPTITTDGWVKRQAHDYTELASSAGDEAWGSNAAIYEFKEEYGDVGPKIPALEVELFGEESTRHEKRGLDYDKIEEIHVQQEGPVKVGPIVTFKDAGLHPVMLENVALSGFDVPTPIQKFTIPSILQGYDVIGIAQTGSGKTAAYLIPILSKLMGKAKKLAAPRPNPATFREGIDEVAAEPLVLVVVPTRELAVQIFNEARKFCYRTMLRPCVVYGGVPVRQQINLLTRGCDILIGTPGRLVDFIHRPHVLTLRRLRYIVIDEADEMLDHDWNEELEKILTGGEQDVGNVKFYLFSATFPKAARDLAKEYLTASHVRFRVGRAGSTTANIKQVVMRAERDEKRAILTDLLNEMHGMRTIIFVNSRQAADNLDDYLYNLGLPVTSMHADRTQKEREIAMRNFRQGTAPIMVATGVTARGIDVQNVRHVINYDLPSIEYGGIEEYTHRIGRTGRIGHRGIATSFFSDRDEPLASVLTRTLLETDQEIPDFLQMHIPEGEARANLKFEADSDFDPDDLVGSGEGWGAEGAATGAGGDGSNAPTSNTAEGDGNAWGGAGEVGNTGGGACNATVDNTAQGSGDTWGGAGDAGGNWGTAPVAAGAW